MNYITINLRQPFFSAAQKYGWTEGVWGIGIDMKLIAKAIEEDRKILVNYKNTKYEITGKNARKQAEIYNSYFDAKGVILAVIPQDKFKRLPDEEDHTPLMTNPQFAERMLKAREELRKKGFDL